jgi:hypothetical protein
MSSREAIMPTFVEMDEQTTLSRQIEETAGPVILINTFTVQADGPHSS